MFQARRRPASQAGKSRSVRARKRRAAALSWAISRTRRSWRRLAVEV